MMLNRTKVSGYLILVGVSQFLLFFIISEILYPNYSVKYNYISDLGVGKTAIIFNTSIVIMGILVIIASILLRANYSPLVFLVGLGAALVGIFPENTGLPHLIASLITFLFGGIGALVTSIKRNYFWGGSSSGFSIRCIVKLKLNLFYEDRGVVEITENELLRARFFSQL